MGRRRSKVPGRNLSRASITYDRPSHMSRVIIEGDRGRIHVLCDPERLIDMLDDAQLTGGGLVFRVVLPEGEVARLLDQARAIPIYIPARTVAAGALRR